MHRIAPCAPYLPRRASDTNKYDYGRVLIVGGWQIFSWPKRSVPAPIPYA